MRARDDGDTRCCAAENRIVNCHLVVVATALDGILFSLFLFIAPPEGGNKTVPARTGVTTKDPKTRGTGGNG